MDVSNYIKTFYPIALQIEKKYGIPAVFALAQSALETGYATSKPGNMMFGMKAGSSWKGKTQKLSTWECGATGNPVKDGIYDEVVAIYKAGDPKGYKSCQSKFSYKVKSIFRAYDTVNDSFEDWAKVLTTRPNFKSAFATKDTVSFATAIARGKYATATNYLDSLKNIIANIELKKKELPQEEKAV